jgi:hypothetical protein
MSFFDTLARIMLPVPYAPVQMAAPEPEAQFAVSIPPEMMQSMTFGGAIAPRVQRTEALQVPAVLRARNLIAGTLASLPVHIHDRARNVAEPTTLLQQIDPDVPNEVTFAHTFEDLLFESVAWWRVVRFGFHGFPTNAVHVPVGSVHVSGTGGLPSRSRVTPDQPFSAGGQVFIDGVPVPDDEIIRFDSPNPPLLVHAARAIRSALRLDRTAANFADEPLPLGFFTPKDGAEEASDDDIQQMLDDWEQARKARAWGYVGSALDVHIPQWNAEQIQLADQRQHAVLEIARATGLDPEDLGVSTTSRTYQNAEQRRLDLLDFTLRPYMVAVEQRLSMRDVMPRGYRVKFNLDAFLRSDTKTRMEAYRLGRAEGAYTKQEIRELEDRPALTPEQEAEVPDAASPRPNLSRNGTKEHTYAG